MIYLNTLYGPHSCDIFIPVAKTNYKHCIIV